MPNWSLGPMKESDSIEELIRIRNAEWAIWDQLMSNLAPKKLSQQE